MCSACPPPSTLVAEGGVLQGDALTVTDDVGLTVVQRRRSGGVFNFMIAIRSSFV